MNAPDRDIIQAPLRVIALGVDMFADALSAQGVVVVRVDWRPPREEVQAAYDLLPLLED